MKKGMLSLLWLCTKHSPCFLSHLETFLQLSEVYFLVLLLQGIVEYSVSLQLDTHTPCFMG
jgi:hypothetical protein